MKNNHSTLITETTVSAIDRDGIFMPEGCEAVSRRKIKGHRVCS